MRQFFNLLLSIALLLPLKVRADELKEGDSAPQFTLKNQDGVDFSLSERSGKGWTVLYFYPKAGTPGCTKQACAFRDAIEKIRALNAAVYGISSDTVADQKRFHEEHQLKFDLLADDDMTVIEAYDAKMPLIGVARRWTFIVDPELRIRWIEKDVDPMLDAKRVAEKLTGLQGEKP
jgi:peroxiredoxin Q/BCP